VECKEFLTRLPLSVPLCLRSKNMTVIDVAGWHPAQLVDIRRMCVHTIIHMCVCMYGRTICVCVCVCVYVCMYVCMYVRTHARMYVCTYVCICVYVRMYVLCMYVLCTHARMCVGTYAYVCLYACMYVCMYVHLCVYHVALLLKWVDPLSKEF
jgi:hypothetical protein